MDIYDTDSIIRTSLTTHTDISPADRQEWVKFCWALKALGWDENTFVALSSGAESDSRKTWRKERNFRMDEDTAKGVIVSLAKAAGMDVKQFLLLPSNGSRRAADTKPRTSPLSRPNRPKPEPPKLPPLFVDLAEVQRAAAEVKRTTLYNFLCGYFKADEVCRVMELYQVGATSEFGAFPALASAFPYINTAGQCVDVHLQPYEADGHRWKQEQHPYFQNWLLAKKKQSDRRAPWCLFGEHLLTSRPAAPVGIVESEKSALICALAAPRYVWVACQGLTNLNAKRCAQIRNRAVYVFPDVDGVEAWRAKAADLHKAGFKVFFCGEYIKANATPGSKEDLADIICRTIKTADQ